ncbi:geranylgeranyl transferase type-2 subunit alpha-like [Brevipalpus obovatus]|uniref:geranylgeranyl transferase type-2 subunit alpha-like n=1 Tax=Brevipalpus obovatus TaxID=246614 RepID=UPI003D9E1ADF
MHGRIKIKTPEEIKAEQNQKDAEQAKMLRESLDILFDKRKNECYDEKAYSITTLLIPQMPDTYVLWNIRREIILDWEKNGHPNNPIKLNENSKVETPKIAGDVNSSLPDGASPQQNNGKPASSVDFNSANQNCSEKVNESANSGDQIQEATKSELSAEDKQKQWSLENEKLLAQLMKRELDFTVTCLVEQPKSYASWYQRMFVIKMITSRGLKIEKWEPKDELRACEKFLTFDERNFHCWNHLRFLCKHCQIDLKQELELTEKKIKKNFSNFSSFYYRSSLLTRAHREKILDLNDIWQKEHDVVMKAIFTDPNDQSPWFYYKWLIAADQFITYQPPQPFDPIYRLIFDPPQSRVVFQFHESFRNPPFDHIKYQLSNQELKEMKQLNWRNHNDSSSHIWFLDLGEASISRLLFDFRGKSYDIPITCSSEDPFWTVLGDIPHGEGLNPNSKLTGENYKQLLDIYELEPKNKWVNLILSSIQGKLQANKFEELRALDPMRENYYLDQKSKCVIESNLEQAQNSNRFQLTDSSLTCLYHVNRLTHLRHLDLSGNCFSRIPDLFNSLVVLEELILDRNQIRFIQKTFRMTSLKKLSLNDNALEIEALEPLKNCSALKTLSIRKNKVANEDDVKKILSSPDIHIDI